MNGVEYFYVLPQNSEGKMEIALLVERLSKLKEETGESQSFNGGVYYFLDESLLNHMPSEYYDIIVYVDFASDEELNYQIAFDIEAYLEYITKKLPYKAFLKLFKLSGDLLDEDIYIDVMNDIATETWDKNSLFDMEYDDFIETLEAFDVEIDLEEEDYQTAVEKINKLEIEGGGLYADKYTSGFSETLIYDCDSKSVY